MIASIDGATAVEGRSGGLSSTSDTAILSALRQRADVVLVGAATVRSEGYGPPTKAGLRIGVVSSNGQHLDFSSPLFTSGAGFVVTTTDAPDLPVETVRAGSLGHVDLADALVALSSRIVGHAGALVSVEGGAGLNAALHTAGLIDEINLTVSPHVVGGESHRLLAGAEERSTRMQLVHLLDDDGYLFARYRRASRPAGQA